MHKITSNVVTHDHTPNGSTDLTSSQNEGFNFFVNYTKITFSRQSVLIDLQMLHTPHIELLIQPYS